MADSENTTTTESAVEQKKLEREVIQKLRDYPQKKEFDNEEITGDMQGVEGVFSLTLHLQTMQHLSSDKFAEERHAYLNYIQQQMNLSSLDEIDEDSAIEFDAKLTNPETYKNFQQQRSEDEIKASAMQQAIFDIDNTPLADFFEKHECKINPKDLDPVSSRHWQSVALFEQNYGNEETSSQLTSYLKDATLGMLQNPKFQLGASIIGLGASIVTCNPLSGFVAATSLVEKMAGTRVGQAIASASKNLFDTGLKAAGVGDERREELTAQAGQSLKMIGSGAKYLGVALAAVSITSIVSNPTGFATAMSELGDAAMKGLGNAYETASNFFLGVDVAAASELNTGVTSPATPAAPQPVALSDLSADNPNHTKYFVENTNLITSEHPQVFLDNLDSMQGFNPDNMEYSDFLELRELNGWSDYHSEADIRDAVAHKVAEFQMNGVDLSSNSNFERIMDSYGVEQSHINAAMDSMHSGQPAPSANAQTVSMAAEVPSISPGSEYTIRKGDTLSEIAQSVAKGMNLENVTTAQLMNISAEIAELNGIEDIDKIHPNQELKMPSAEVIAGTPNGSLTEKASLAMSKGSYPGTVQLAQNLNGVMSNPGMNAGHAAVQASEIAEAASHDKTTSQVTVTTTTTINSDDPKAMEKFVAALADGDSLEKWQDTLDSTSTNKGHSPG